MIDRRLVLALALSAALAGPAVAFDFKPFDAKAFEAAKTAGKPILIEVSAPWCPTCKAQKPILSSLGKEPRFKDVVAFEVDFDSRKDVLRTLNVRQQSTLISFKGATETARSVGVTDPAAIEALIAKAL